MQGREAIAVTNSATSALPSTSLGTPYPVVPTPKRPRKRVVLASLGVGAIALTIMGVRWWQYTRTYQETDNAYITSHIHPVNSRVSGTVTQVLVDDNQRVLQGQLLVQDPRDYEVALQQAQAALDGSTPSGSCGTD